MASDITHSSESNVLARVPWRMRPFAEALILNSREESPRAAELAEIVVTELGAELVSQGVNRWEDAKPQHYETWLRKKQAHLRKAPDAERDRFTGAAVKARELFDMVEEATPDFENPAGLVTMTRTLVVSKRGQTAPDLDPKIDAFVRENHSNPREAVQKRAALRSMAGSMLAHGVTRWEDLKPGHVDIIAKEWVEASRNAGKPSAQKIQYDLATSRLFFDSLVRQGVLKENPSEDLLVTLHGRVTTPEGFDSKMFDQAQEYLAKRSERDAISTSAARRNALKRFALQMIEEHNITDWSEVTPAHAELFLRRRWGLEYSTPSNAMFSQSTAREMLDFLRDEGVVKKNPMDGMSFTINGEFRAPGRKDELLPQRPEAVLREKLDAEDPMKNLPEGFRAAAVEYRDRSMVEKLSNVHRINRNIPLFVEVAVKRGEHNWAEVSRDTVVEFGKGLFGDGTGKNNTAAMAFSSVRGLFKDLDAQNKIPFNPFRGVEVVKASTLSVQPNQPPRKMEAEINECARKRVEPSLREAYVKHVCQFAGEMHARGKDWADISIGDVAGAIERSSNLSLREECRELFQHLRDKGIVNHLPIPIAADGRKRRERPPVEREDSVVLPQIGQPLYLDLDFPKRAYVRRAPTPPGIG